MTYRRIRHRDDLRRRQPLLGDQRRLHPPPRPEVRRPGRRAEGGRRQAPLLLRGAGPPDHPGSGRRPPAPRPGALYDYFAGKSSKARVGNELACEDARRPPRVVRPRRPTACMDDQGVEAAWLFPSQGVCMEGPMQPDIEASDRRPAGLQPLARGGLGLRLPGPDLRRPLPDALRPRPGRRASSSGASTAAPGSSPSATVPPSRPRALRSPADPMFDPFWARVQEAGIVVTAHAGLRGRLYATWRRTSPGRGASPTGRAGASATRRGGVHPPHGGPAHEAPADRGLRHRPGRPQALRALPRRRGGLHRERRATGCRACCTRLQMLARSEPGHVHAQTRSSSSSSTAGWRRSSRTTSRTWPGTCRSSGSSSAPTGRTPKALPTPATSSPMWRRSRSTTSAGSWSRTPGS